MAAALLQAFSSLYDAVPRWRPSTRSRSEFAVEANAFSGRVQSATVDHGLVASAKLYSRINIDQQSISLQHSLGRLPSWADSWKLAIKISKCCVVSTCSIKVASCKKLYSDRNLTPSASNTLDLGITTTNNFSFPAHINNIVAKVLQRNSTFFRGFIIFCRN